MKKGQGKRKGNSYEIQIARIFTKWFNPKTKEDLFWRTAGSGAKATRGKGAATSFYGDITFLPDPNSLLVWIDCKNRKDVTFNNILTDKFLPLKWYKEEEEKQKQLKIEKPILIIFKLHNKKENYVFFKSYYFLFSGNLFDYPLFSNGKFTMVLLNDFLNLCSKNDIIEL